MGGGVGPPSRSFPPIVAIVRGGLGNQLLTWFAGSRLSEASSRELLLNTRWFRLNSPPGTRAAHRRDFILHKYTGLSTTFRTMSPGAEWSTYQMFRALSRLPVTPRGVALEAGRFRRPPRTGDWLVDGLFPDAESAISHRQRLRQLLKPTETEIQRMHRAHPWLSRARNYVAVHVRRGDRTLTPEMSSHMLQPSYYRRALAEIDSDAPSILVFSDSLDGLDLRAFPRGCTFVDEPDPRMALFLMSSCGSLVMADSSLSWWAAVLGHGDRDSIIVPTPFWTPSTLHAGEAIGAAWRRVER